MTWTVTANIVRRRLLGPPRTPPGDEQPEKRVVSGTKHFRGGAKVHVVGAYGGMTEAVVVVGPHRSGKGYVLSTVKVWYLTNRKATVLYKPVVATLAEHVDEQARLGPLDEAGAVAVVAALTAWIEDERRRREEKGQPWWVVEP